MAEENMRLYRCYYCNVDVDLAELEQVEEEIRELGDETVELVYDHLPKSEFEKKPPYTHITERGVEVLNLCLDCWNRLLLLD